MRHAFMGEKRTVGANLSQIVSIEPYRDAVAVHRPNKQRLEMYCDLDRYGFPFEWEGRTHEAILTGRVVACAFEGLIAESEATPPARRPASAARTGMRSRAAHAAPWMSSRGWRSCAPAGRSATRSSPSSRRGSSTADRAARLPGARPEHRAQREASAVRRGAERHGTAALPRFGARAADVDGRAAVAGGEDGAADDNVALQPWAPKEASA